MRARVHPISKLIALDLAQKSDDLMRAFVNWQLDFSSAQRCSKLKIRQTDVGFASTIISRRVAIFFTFKSECAKEQVNFNSLQLICCYFWLEITIFRGPVKFYIFF